MGVVVLVPPGSTTRRSSRGPRVLVGLSGPLWCAAGSGGSGQRILVLKEFSGVMFVPGTEGSQRGP